ncbi:T9SS type A sorting domain-containing protein [Empedobacter brevis]
MKTHLFFLLFIFLIKTNLLAQSTPNDPLFFEKGSTWLYLDDGSNQQKEWTLLTYDTKNWKEGKGHFGFGDGDEDTLIQKGYIRYFFRKKITIDDVTKLPEEVIFNIVHDDAAILHINGKEILRSSLLPQSGDIPHEYELSTFIPNDKENSFFQYNVSSSNFVNGENIISIEIRNQNTRSSDVSFDCFVSEDNTTPVPFHKDGPYVFYDNDQITVTYITEAGVVNETYTTNDKVILKVTDPTTSTTFDVPLKKQHQTELSTYLAPSKFFMTSDIEGQFSAFKKMLIDGGVMNDRLEWTYENGHLIVNGDMVDRGPYVTEVLWLIYKLETEAEAKGGKVHYIIGNHDMMTMTYDFRYVNKKYIENASYLKKTYGDFFEPNTAFGKWFRTKNIIEQLGDYTFVHAGISPQVSDLKLPLDEMNDYGRKKMNGESCTGNCATVTGGSASGLYWYRGMANQVLSQTQVDDILTNFKTKHIIIAHTVFPQITSLYNDKVIAIDVSHVDNIANNKVEALTFSDSCFKTMVSIGNQITFKNLFDKCENLSISEKIKQNITIYPNPTTDWINIEANSNQNLSIKLVDINGRKIPSPSTKTSKGIKTNIQALPKGIYLLKVYDNGQEILTKKIIRK